MRRVHLGRSVVVGNVNRSSLKGHLRPCTILAAERATSPSRPLCQHKEGGHEEGSGRELPLGNAIVKLDTLLFHLLVLIFMAAETTYQPHITVFLFHLLIFVAAETTYQPHIPILSYPKFVRSFVFLRSSYVKVYKWQYSPN